MSRTVILLTTPEEMAACQEKTKQPSVPISYAVGLLACALLEYPEVVIALDPKTGDAIGAFSDSQGVVRKRYRATRNKAKRYYTAQEIR